MRYILFALALFASSAPAAAQEDVMEILAQIEGEGERYVAPRRSAVRDGFAFPTNAPIRIILFRPDVKVTEKTTAGLDQPKADWTETARMQLAQAMQTEQARRGVDLLQMSELAGDEAKVMADYKRLFKFVADAAIRHQLFADTPLPTKKDKFDWSLGSGIGQLGKLGGADYGLFLYTQDSYESQGFRNAQLIGKLMGVGASSLAGPGEPEERIGYAGLVDLKSGELVWLNVDVNSRGDVRTALGADVRVTNLLAGFPAAVKGIAKGKGK